jgi:hypothetical protein
MDLRGVGIMSASQAYGYLQEASKVGQNYYPERMGKTSLSIYVDCKENSTSSMRRGDSRPFGR